MTGDRKSETPGMAEVSAKFEHEAEATAFDPLLEVIRKHQEADAASDRSYEALDEAEGDARKRGTDLPRWGLIEFKMEGTQWTLGRGEIERAATSAGHHGLHLTTEQRDTYLAQLDELRRKGIAHYKELGLDTLYLENEHCREAFWESLERVSATPAVSVEGFAAKVLVFCDHSNEDNVPPADLARSVRADAEQFARKGQRKEAISENYSDLHRLLTGSAEKGNEKARSALSEDFDWRNMSFVRCQGIKTAIQWPPVELTSQHGDSVYGAACVIGNHCALDLIGHIKSHSKHYDGGRLLDVAQEIAKRGEWDGFEVGFFSVLGNFIAWGRVPISGDFDAVLAEEARS